MPERGITAAQLDELFPFLVVVDRELRVSRVGRSLGRQCGPLQPGVRFDEVFTIERPRVELDFDAIAAYSHAAFVLAPRCPLPSLKGQVMRSASGDELIFVVRPILSGSDSLLRYNLSSRDFAVHDPIVDYLFLLQAQETGMKDLREMAAALEAERVRLQAANGELQMLYGVADELATTGPISEVCGEAIGLVCRTLGWDGGALWRRSEDGGVSRLAVWPPDASTIPGHARPSPSSAVGQVMTTQRAAVATGLDAGDPVEAAALERGAVRSYCVPVHFADAAGAIQFFSSRAEAPFDPVRGLHTIATRLAEFVDEAGEREKLEAEAHAQLASLAHAAQNAEDRNRRKTEYMSHVSHDIRTPMNAVLGMSELLLGTELDAKQRDYAVIVRDATISLLGVINASLDLSKIEAGRLELASAPIDLYTLVDDCAYLLAQSARKKGVALSWTIAPSVPRAVLGDADRLRQVLSNLLGNAVKFTDQGTVRLDVELDERVESSCRVVFRVVDTGCGIAADDLQRICEPFVQAGGAGGGDASGSGLGLAIARALARLMDSDLAIASEPGEGTTVSVRPRFGLCDSVDTCGLECVWRPPPSLADAPVVLVGSPAGAVAKTLLRLQTRLEVRAEGDALADEAKIVVDLSERYAERAALARALPVHRVVTVGGQALDGIAHVIGWPPRERALAEMLSGDEDTRSDSIRIEAPLARRVLVVDDTRINRRLVSEFLHLWGCEVDEADDGDTAIEMWSRRDYDLIIMDCEMPRLGGLEATRHIRANEATGTRTPILALTAWALAEDLDKCTAAGMDDYLSKPVIPEQLRAKLVRIFDEADAAESAVPLLDDASWARLTDLEARVGPGLVSDICGLFATESMERIVELRCAFERSDRDAVNKIAHRLKGTAGNIGANRVVSLCEQLLQRPSATQALIDETVAAIDATNRALDDRRAGRAPA